MPELYDGIVKLSGTTCKSSSDELGVFAKLAEQSGVIGLGEVVHASSEIIRMKNTISRYLIERHGYRVIALEKAVLRSKPIEKWVANLSDNLPSTDCYAWPLKEEQDFLSWLRAFNLENPHDPVRVFGFDIWDRPWERQSQMEELTAKLQLPDLDQIKIARNTCCAHNDTDWQNLDAEVMPRLGQRRALPKTTHQSCIAALSELRMRIKVLTEANRSSDTIKDLYDLLILLDSSLGFQKYLNAAHGCISEAWGARDETMANNVYHSWLKFGRRKMIIRAHTSHVARMESPSDWWRYGTGNIRSCVSFLKDLMPARVGAIAVTGFNISSLQGTFVRPSSENSLECRLNKLGFEYAVVDTAAPLIKSKKKWWLHNENRDDERSYKDGVLLIPEDNFDLIAFVNESPEATPLASRNYTSWNARHRW